jgi:hypothetical protein
MEPEEAQNSNTVVLAVEVVMMNLNETDHALDQTNPSNLHRPTSLGTSYF